MPKFIPGLQLFEKFYKEVVKNLFESKFPELKYSAGLIDYGSEVLGFDTERSTDHHWGPRLMIFLSSKDLHRKKEISDYFSKKLPPLFCGYSTNFGDPDDIGVQLLSKVKENQPINHRIDIYSIESFFKKYLLSSPDEDLTVFDWLTFSEQKLCTIRYGKIFFDQLGLKKVQKKLHYFPKDVWLYMLASEWMKIGQEEPFVGRAGDVGDELGSRIIAVRLVQSIMKLCFLMEKDYSPYSKWFGTAFSRLKCAKELMPILNAVIDAKDWKGRERKLAQAYGIIAKMHNNLKLTKSLPVEVSSFHDRPYLVINGSAFALEIKKNIKNQLIKKIPYDIGSVNQLSNAVDFLENDKLLRKIKILYQ